MYIYFIIFTIEEHRQGVGVTEYKKVNACVISTKHYQN